MASYLQKMIFIPLILSMALTTSIGHREESRRIEDSDTEENLKDLCSETEKPDICWNILKPELHRFDDSDYLGTAESIVDLAMEKSKEIRDHLNQWFLDSKDDKLKQKYHLCSKNYEDADHNLDKLRRNLNSDDYHEMSDKIADAEKELDECRRVFGPHSFDPAHVGDRNNELGLYLDMVKVATGYL